MYPGFSKPESRSLQKVKNWWSPPPSSKPNVSQPEHNSPPATADHMAAILEITRDLTADKDSDSGDEGSKAMVKAKDLTGTNDGSGEGEEESNEDDGSNTPDDNSDSSSDSEDGGVRLGWETDPHLRDLTVYRVMEGEKNSEGLESGAEAAVEHNDVPDGP